MSLSSDYLIDLWHQFDKWQTQAETLLQEISSSQNLVLAVDFSELYQYMYTETDRHKMLSHIVSNINRMLTLPPGACYELLAHANNTVGRPDMDKWSSFKTHESVESFLQKYSEAKNPEGQIAAYRDIDDSIKDTLKQIASITYPESPWRRISNLLDSDSMKPLGEFVRINELRVDARIEQEVRKSLEVASRAFLDQNNMIDSLNYAVIYACNEWQMDAGKPILEDLYYAIFTGSTIVASVYSKYPWQEQQIVRRAEYLKIMANLNTINESRSEQRKYLKNCIQLIKELKELIFSALGPLAVYVRNLERKRKVKRIDVPQTMISRFAEFQDKYYYPLFSIELEVPEGEAERKRQELKRIYEMMSKQGEYESAMKDAYSVMSVFFDRVSMFLEDFETEGSVREQVKQALQKLSSSGQNEIAKQ